MMRACVQMRRMDRVAPFDTRLNVAGCHPVDINTQNISHIRLQALESKGKYVKKARRSELLSSDK